MEERTPDPDGILDEAFRDAIRPTTLDDYDPDVHPMADRDWDDLMDDIACGDQRTADAAMEEMRRRGSIEIRDGECY